ncbi:sugar diacid recognition domain-containing protein [Alkaliphilus transvaalensis]|uniref:sugar diacid recognition domain-containing protein n=1 Tax=Alkaliphilus transvaalensis TaxID=114628 RepID=UPI00047CECB9|nr:sugar diacid recognition domain-containing protein [Alkaliphilus transvaalensis]
MTIIESSFAQQLVNLIYKETDQNAHIFGDGGVIIATTQKERLGTIHEGAKDIMAGKIDSIAITKEMTENLKGARAGFSVGINYEDQRIGAIGISGEPIEVKPVAMMAAHMISLEYERKLFLSKLNAMASNININLQESSAGLEELSASSEEQSATIEFLNSMVNETKTKILETNKIIDFIHNISRQTTILGINASIEAARIGIEGRGFNVVASEIQKLSEHTSKSVTQIEEVIKNVQELVSNVSDNILTYTDSTNQQSIVIQSLAEEMESITSSVDAFVKNLN